jgi:lysophospholipid acyltransferase (LPLAT)-like uncharacterized protein
MIRGMRQGLSMGFTVDGPKGPRHEAKPGALLLAKKTGNPVLPFILQPRRFWTLKSWDKLQVPRPFTRAVFIYGKPITVESSASEDDIKLKTDELQGELDHLVNRSNDWCKQS